MKMKMIKVSFMILTLLISGSLALAGVQTIDFNDGNTKDWTVIAGDWKVEKGAYNETAGANYARTLYGDMNWKDYTVEVDLTLLKTAGANPCAGLLVRVGEKGENGYRFWIRTDGPRAQLSKWVDTTNYTHVAEPALDIKVGEKYRLKIIIEGQRYQCFVNDKSVADYEDKAKFRESGKMGRRLDV